MSSSRTLSLHSSHRFGANSESPPSIVALPQAADISEGNSTMSPREKLPETATDSPLLGYQAKAVDLPDDHYDDDDDATVATSNSHTSQHKSSGKKTWLAALLAFVGVLWIALQQMDQPNKDQASSSTLLRLVVDEWKFEDPTVWELLNLNQSMTGRVWLSSRDAKDEFAAAAKVWRQDQKLPRAVVEAHTEQDVQLALPILDKLQQQQSVPFRIRSGGHSKAGFSSVADGIILSLKHLKSRSILVEDYDDPVHTNNVLATIEPGSTVEDVLDKFLQHADETEELYGGALGQCGKVAEGGWVLGGGVGFMSRLLGLGLDNAREFRVVLANGTAVTANDKEHTDLFWALRGAGQGNYGVVTSMTYQLYRVPDVQLLQTLFIPAEDMGDFFYRLGEADTDHEIFAVTGGKGPLVTCWISWFSLDADLEKNARKANQHFDEVIRPILPSSAIFNDSYTTFLWAEETHEIFDEGYGTEVYAAQSWQGFLLPANNTPQVWETIMGYIAKGMEVAPDVGPHIELWGGAISDVDVQATAFPYRDAVYNVGVSLVVQDYDETAQERFEQQVASVNSWWPKVAQYLTGSYLNYPMNSLREKEYPRLYWGDHLERLVDIKQRYDPTNAFAFEQSMPLGL